METKIAINSCFSQNNEPKYLVLLAAYRVQCLQEMAVQQSKVTHAFFSQQYDHVSTNKQDSHQFKLASTDFIPTSSQPNEDSTQLQNRMVAIDRMKSIDKLISEIVYNHNHSLAVMNNFLCGCIRRMESKKFNADDILLILKKVNVQTKQLADIITSLKCLTSKSIYRYEAVCLNQLFQETISLIRYETSDFPIEIHFECETDLPWVKVDKLHIQQVILNLMCNAIESMRDAKVTHPQLSILIKHPLDKNNVLEIAVTDNGPGFNCDSEQLFSPSFTTKSYGSGLGLAVSRTIIQNHGGQLVAELNHGCGACFKFTLPIKSANMLNDK